MRRLLFAFVLAASLVPVAAHARSLELSLNDDVAQFLVTTQTRPFGVHNAEFGVGVLFNDDDDLIGSLRLMSTNRVSPSLRLGVGLQGYLGDLDRPDETMGGSAVGGNVGIGLAAQVPLFLVLEGWVAPGVLSFGDTDKIKEWSARVEAHISPHAAFFVGYRQLKVDLETLSRDYEVDDSAFIGVRLGF
ncbi:MAG: hypothetical protein GX093_03715 [Xanthomonadaceae bacterium]|nr:hypothetical protein [Xanthomonadaceae bacterium]